MIAMAPAALVAAMDREHPAAPQIGETIEQAGMAGAFG